MESHVGTFPYRKLEPGTPEIRIIFLEPGNRGDPICCKIKHVNLDQKPPYQALSYVWGDPQDTSKVTLDGLAVPVTANLYIALRYLRHKTKAQPLWIDALCINQGDLEERADQVTRMADIYRRASRVLLWVGEEESDSAVGEGITAREIFMYMTSMHATAEGYTSGEMVFPDYYDHRLRSIFLTAEDGGEEDNEDSTPAIDPGKDPRLTVDFWDLRHALVRFAHRPWFKRMWIIQEATAHPRTLIVCGGAAMSWTLFLRGLMSVPAALRISTLDGPIYDHKMASVLALGQCASLQEQWRDTAGVDPEQVAARIMTLLFTLGGNFESTDPRDRVFGIMGMVPEATETLASAGLPVSYDRSAGAILADLACFLITRLSSLDVLIACGAAWDDLHSQLSASHPLGGMPSWAPTWGYHSYNSLHLMQLARLRDNPPRQGAVAYFHFLMEDLPAMFVRGAALGKISLLAKNMSQARIMLESVPEPPEDTLPRLEDLLRESESSVLASPLVKERYTSSKEALRAWRDALFHIGDEYELSIRHFGYEVTLGRENMSIVPEDQKVYVKRDLDMFNALDQELLSKTAFVVSTGHIAVAESRRRPDMGDMVCLIPGCSFPMILRPHEELDDVFTVVGACYIKDFMTEEGQAAFLAEKDLQEFCLV